MNIKKKDDKQSFNGLRRNSNYIKRFIATAVVFVMLFESGISPWISFAPAYAYAAEDEEQESYMSAAEDDEQDSYMSAYAASGTSQDTQYEAAGAGTEEQTGLGESAQEGSETGDKNDDDASGGPDTESGTETGKEDDGSGQSDTGDTNEDDGSGQSGTGDTKEDDGSGQSDTGDTKEDDGSGQSGTGDTEEDETDLPDNEETESDKTDADKDADKDKKASGEDGEEDIESETESELISDDDNVKLIFGAKTRVPRGSDLRVDEIYGGGDYEAYVNAALEASALSPDQIAGLKVLDISIVNNGKEIDPGNSVNVEINADYLFGKKALYADDEVLAVQVDSDAVYETGSDGAYDDDSGAGDSYIPDDTAYILGTEVNSGEDEAAYGDGYEDEAIWSEDGYGSADPNRAPSFTGKADSVSFSTDSFPVFVFIQPIQEKIVTATDGSSYEITAYYDNASGIPAGTGLKIEEAAQGSDEMQHYYEECAALFDESVYSVEAIRAFDISFADLETGDEYEPDKEMGLSIKLLSNGLIDGAECRLVRFAGATEEMGFGLDTEEQTLSFEAQDMPVYGVVQLAVKKQLRAGDGSTYEVTVYYDSVSGIPDNAVLSVSEITEEDESFDGYVERSSDEVDNAPGTVKVARAFDISLINPDTGEEYQPIKPVQVNIELLDENLEDCESLDVVHIHGESEEQTELLESSVNEGAIEFESEGFSVYVVVKTVKAKTLTASDGRKYSVTVYYDSDSGIPEDAELVVNEIPEGSDEYLGYLDKSADALGKKPEYLDMARAFDISFTDPSTGEKYQPTKDVSVNIRLLDDDLNNYVYVDVVHFPEDSNNAAVVMDSSDNGESVEFKTDGFSVYVLTGGSHLGTFYFFSINNYGDYQGYMFTDDKGNQVGSQTIKSGEKLVAPLNPSGDPDNPREFKGWYKGDSENSLESEPFDFTKPQTFTEDTSVNLYAVFADYAYVTFHERYDSGTQSYPVAETRRVELLNNTPGTLDISDVRVSYYDTNAVNGMPGYVFYGWSETPIQTPGEGTDADLIQGPTIPVSGNTDLYPLFKQVHWLSFISGNSGTGATYYAPVAVGAGESLTESVVKSSFIPTRQGYTFTGWYLDVTDEGTDAQNGTGTQITDAAATLQQVQDNDKGIQVFSGSDAYLLLSKNVTLYAGWQADETDVTVVIRKQRATDENDLTDDKKTYDYAESFTVRSQPGTSIQVVSGIGTGAGAVTECALADYEALNDNVKYNSVHPDAQLPEGTDNPYKGYSFNAAKTLTDTDKTAGADTGSKKVSGDGATVINLYYDKDSSVTSAGGSFTLTFSFTKPADGSSKTVENVASGTKLSAVQGRPQPAGTAPEGQEFAWYYDQGCTTPVNFDTDTMPDHDLTLYGGWTKKWYLIQIDPNYGDLNGKGSTYFWKTYQSDYIQEYTWVTRDYVPSGSGQYYYVNHDYDYAKTDPDSDRLSYYTTDINKATELTTFKESKGEYLYDGWYQVNDDGTETPYAFGQPIEGDTTLRLHWKKTGTYYLQYNADVTVDGKRLAGRISDNSVSPDPSGYSDKSDIILNSYADAPDGYAFTGWQVRDDDSGKVYNPGDTFIINGEQAVTVNGKKTIYLDAVYTRIKTAVIIYNANGGTISAYADGGYPYKLGTEGKPVMNDEGKPVNLNTHVVTKSSESELMVSGLTNNSPIRLSSGEGFSYSFTDESGSQAELTISGWNTESDGSGTHYDLGSFKDSEGNYYYVDTTEPVTLYAEWKVTVYFDKNSETYPGAEFSATGWSGYTLISDPEDPHNGQYSIETTVGALLKEPEGEVTSASPALNFDFWSIKKDGDQTNAFDFARTKVTGSMVLYAHLADVIKVPYHVVSSNKVDRDEWRKTDKLRVSTMAIDMRTGSSFSEYVTPISAEYTYAYACLSSSVDNISDTNDSKIVSLSLDTDRKVTATLADNTTAVLNAGKTSDNRQIYLVYSAENADTRVKLAYVKEGQSGALSGISQVRYNGHEFSTLNGSLYPSILNDKIASNGSINGETVTGQVLTLSETPLEISQRMAQGVFNAPPMLDDPDKTTDGALSLVYDSFGVGASGAANVSAVDGKSQTLYLRYYDGRRQWSADKKSWTILEGDTLYVIFRERGNELRITKAVTGDDTKLDPNMSFKVTVTSTAITHSDYKTEGTGHASVSAVPANGFNPGSITLTVKDGSDIHIKDLPAGEYTITEEHNSNFTLEAKDEGATAAVEESDGSGSVKVTVEADRKVDLFNKPYEICRVFNVDMLEGKTFYTLNSALEYIRNNLDGSGDIEMLRDYVIPEWDALEIPAGFDITLTSDTRTSQRYTIMRDDSFVSGAMFTNNGKFTIENITLDGDQVSTESPMVANKGQLTIDAGAVLQNANNTGDGGTISQERGSLTVREGAAFTDNKGKNGGAISVSAGSVSIEGGTFSGNTAANGGAVYYSGSSSMTVSGGTFSGNTATNGGSIYTVSGNITVSGGSFNGSYKEGEEYSATNGGAIYSEKATLTLKGGTFNGVKASQNGGAVYAQAGNLTMSGAAFTGNSTISGNGGALYCESGNISITGGTISGNSAVSGEGGAIWLGSGRMEMTNGTIGGSNSAINGAGIFVQSGNATLSGGSVTGNTASAGGAIGVGSADARLVFSGGVKVNNNINSSLPEENQRSNIYLDQDSDDVITISGLGKSAAIGVYAADSVIDTRGVPGAKFGSYTDDANKNTITNDRDPSFTVVSEASSKKLYWGMGIKVEVRYQPYSFMSKGFPPKDSDYTSKTIDTYYPVVGDNGYVALSALAEDLYKNNTDVRDGLLKNKNTAAYAGAFIKKDDATYDDYLIKLSWDKTNDKWILTKSDNSTTIELGTDTLLIYYAEPAYIAIENNTAMPLDISDIVMGSGENTRRVVNSSSVVGYGMTYAKNGAVRKELLPVEADDLKLAAAASVTLIIPGGRNTDYRLTGKYTSDGTTQDVKLRRSKTSATDLEEKVLGLDTSGAFITLGGEALSGSSFTGKTLSKAGTYHIIFGDDKKICKIRTTTIESAALDPDTAVTNREIAGFTVDRTETEYLFTTLTQAMNFVKNYMNGEPYNKTAAIEMLTDYLLPSTDQLKIPVGYHITLTTASNGQNVYTPATEGEPRATISRDQENTAAMLTATGNADDPAGTTFEIKDLIIDGKSVRGSSDGGAVSTKDCNVTVENVKFENIYAGNGGALFVAITDKKHGKGSALTVKKSDFINCHSSKTGSRDGGGAIHAYVDHLTLEDCTFTSCEAYWQAGAVFHKVELTNAAGDTSSTVSNCTFTSCESKAAGGLELGSHKIMVSGCTFEHCIATDRNGGGFNVYALNSASPTVECHTTVTDCTFIDCHVTGTNPGNGGGFRSTSTHTAIINTTFNNTSAKFGGAVALSNEKAVKAELNGCSINDARSVNNGNGGGIFSYAKEFIVSDTQITNCTSQGKGGAIYHKRDADGTSLTVTNTVITGNSCTANTGGGVAVENVRSATFTGCTISDNTAKSNGGGIWIGNKGTAAGLIVDSSLIRNNSSGDIGGGIYSDANLTLRNDTNITENSITATPGDASDNAGGVYIKDKCRLIMGTAEATAIDLTTVKGNTDGSGAPSDLRLYWDKNNRSSKENSVSVLCSLGGEIRVVNPGKPMQQFGTRDADTYAGFTEGSHVFIADTGGLYGVFDRSDHKKLIWRGGVVCKITDASGHLLYLDPECKDPAVFDRLDYKTGGSKLSPFSYLRQNNPVLYRKGGALIDLTQEEICVKLLVDTYETDTNITTGSYSGRKLVTLTTASSTDTDGYPYTGRAGTYATIRRTYTDNAKSMIETGVNLTLKNITLDGASTDKADPKAFTTDGGLIKANTNGIKVTLAANSVLQNSRISNDKKGGAIFVGSGASLLIAGGAIYNCGTEFGNGGAVCKNGSGSFEFTSGNISKCFAKNGGGVYFDDGSSFDMSGSAQIKGCTASENGGGVYLNAKRIMNMTGGSITGNHAGSAGGGIYLGDNKDTRLNLSGRVTISGNTADKDENGTGNPKSVPCNVELVKDTNDIINSKGISRNSYIGVYVSGVESQGDNPDDKNTSLYDKHGLEGKPFGKYTGITDYLYCFVNDRNGLKGGLKPGDTTTIYWVRIFSLRVSKTVISGEESDLNDEFTFRVTFSKREGGAQISGFNYYFTYDDGRLDDGGEPKKIQITDGFTEFKLKNKDVVTVDNLPAEIDSGKVYYKVEEVLTPEQTGHYRTSTLRSSAKKGQQNGENGSSSEAAGTQSEKDRIVTGTIGENLYREDVSSKYTSDVVYDNTNAICKLTSSKNGGVLLYTLDPKTDKPIPAVYSALYRGNADSDKDKPIGAFDVIDHKTDLYYFNEFTNKYEKYDYDGTDILSVEMLIEEYEMKKAVTVKEEQGTSASGAKGINVTLTTADPRAEDGYPYVGTAGTDAKIKRGFNKSVDAMFILENSSGGGSASNKVTELTLKSIILDGNKDNYSSSGKAGIVRVNDYCRLVITEGAYLQNSKNSGNGGAAVYIGAKAEAEMNGGTVRNNECTGNATYGAAFYVSAWYEKGVGYGAKLTLSGSPVITGNTSESRGPGIYLHAVTDGTAKLYISGSPQFSGNTGTNGGAGDGSTTGDGGSTGASGSIDETCNTVTVSGYADKLNGQEKVYNGGKVRQDIYIAEKHENAPESIIVNGLLDGDPGSIWVWAENDVHYRQLMPFARIEGVTYKESPSLSEYNSINLKVFRNAQDDEATMNGTSSYLYGTTRDDMPGYVFWNGVEGSAHVILVKVQDTGTKGYNALSGKKFRVYSNKEKTVPAKGKTLDDNGKEADIYLAPLAGGSGGASGGSGGASGGSGGASGGTTVITTDWLEAGDGGAFFIGELPYGTYYVEEEGVSGQVFVITIDKGGVVNITDPDTDPKTTEPVKTVELSTP